MKKFAPTLVVGVLALSATACGSDSGSGGGDGAKDKLVASLLADDSAGVVDEACVRSNVDQLSDSDAALLADNLDAEEMPDGLSADAMGVMIGLIDCIELDFDLDELEE